MSHNERSVTGLILTHIIVAGGGNITLTNGDSNHIINKTGFSWGQYLKMCVCVCVFLKWH